ncbi:hypothetical protein K493DRAFT_259815 [Basidiobolus meristosporus CBS 931.73]|uniref:BZIP domain-containing protein n=1 Tax=Basidiobolus meristosporus CBS 931.73 TaxID=1314790 RepID=A0A1Y1YE00_9FUNG|nr:hypothetical protein K493DRAFT_259815 [Basidiobolus meristosporus CBS 931.73]|eukprot:ORX96271.1 hypothetical protein K493DRAFT_259815 [Basidiobolus meristosporus CBS 931.73]
MDISGQFNGVLFNYEQDRLNLDLWSSASMCFDPATSFHLDSFPLLDTTNNAQMNSVLSDSPSQLSIFPCFSDSSSTLGPPSSPELIHSPPFSPISTSATPFSAAGMHKSSPASFTPILPNGIPQSDITSTKEVSPPKRKLNPDREASRAALLAAAANDPKLAAKLESLEDKRRRNTAASARFRIKKKQREEALEKTTKELSVKTSLLENKVKELEMEVKWLQGLLIDKDPEFVNVVPPFKKQCI